MEDKIGLLDEDSEEFEILLKGLVVLVDCELWDFFIFFGNEVMESKDIKLVGEGGEMVFGFVLGLGIGWG